MSFLSSLWDSLTRFITIILVIVAIVLLICACIASGQPEGLGVAWGVLAGYGALQLSVLALLTGLLAYMIDPATASEMFGKIGSFASAVLNTVGTTVASVGAGVLGALLSNPLVGVVLGVGLFMYFRGKKPDSVQVIQPSTHQLEGGNFTV